MTKPLEVAYFEGHLVMTYIDSFLGCRILVTLLHTLLRTGKRKGVAALCIGGGSKLPTKVYEIVYFRSGF